MARRMLPAGHHCIRLDPAQVQCQLCSTIGAHQHRDAPVLLVQVASSMVGDLPAGIFRPVARGGTGSQVQHAFRHVG